MILHSHAIRHAMPQATRFAAGWLRLPAIKVARLREPGNSM